MNQLIMQNEQHDLITFDDSQIELIKRTIAKGASDDQLALFMHQARRTGLDPLAKQIHCILRWNNKEKRHDMSIQTAIDGYRLVADRTGTYAGNDDYLFDNGLTQFQHLTDAGGFPATATATVYKIVAGIRVPFSATAAWGAYAPSGNQGFMWKKMPYLMLGKCAEALALRKAFPAELSGMYVREEMEQAGFVEAEAPTQQQIAREMASAYDDGDLFDEEDEPEDEAPAEIDLDKIEEWKQRAIGTSFPTFASCIQNAGLYQHQKHVERALAENDLEYSKDESAALWDYLAARKMPMEEGSDV